MILGSHHRFRLMVSAIAAASIVAVSNLSLAQPPQAPPRPPVQGARPAPGATGQKAVPPAGQQAAGQKPGALALTEAQRDQIKAIREQGRKDMQALRERQRTAQQKLRDALRADAYDENAVKAASSAVASVQADRIVQQARLRNQVSKVYTPEQQQRMKARRAPAQPRLRNLQMRRQPQGAVRPPAGRRMQPGMGPGRGAGMGHQGPGPGMGQGLGPGMGQGLGPGMGQGLGPGAGRGLQPGIGQGMGPGVGRGMGPGGGIGAEVARPRAMQQLRRRLLMRRLLMQLRIRRNWL